MKQDSENKVNDLKQLIYDSNGHLDCTIVSNRYGDDILKFKQNVDNSINELYFNLTNIYDLLKRYTNTNNVILTPSEYKDELKEKKQTCKITTNDGDTMEV